MKLFNRSNALVKNKLCVTGFCLVVNLLALSSSTYAQQLDRVSVQLDWMPAGDKAFFTLGVAKGFYKKQGIDATFRSGRGSSDAIMQTAIGNADLATAGLSTLMIAKSENDIPVKAVMSFYSKLPDAIFTTEESGITGIDTANGKIVAMPTFSSSTVLWPALLKQNHVSVSAIKTLKVDPSSLIPLLAQDNVQMTLSWVVKAPEFKHALNGSNRTLKIITFSDLGINSYGWSLIASEKMINERSDVLKRFIVATKESIFYANQHPFEAAKALKESTPEIDEAISAEIYKASIPLLENDISKRDGLGAFNPKLLALTWYWVATSMDYKADALDPESVVDRRFVVNDN